MSKTTTEIFELIDKEADRQENEICLIASENYTSVEVMDVQGSILTNKYAEGYPGKRYYGGCHIIDQVEEAAIENVKELFGCKFANVQPHSGSQANQAVYLALLKPGETILGMSLDEGGHLTHGSKVSSSGKLYNSIQYGIDENGIIDYEDIKKKLYEHHPKLLVVGASAYPREIDFVKIKSIVEDYNQSIYYENGGSNNPNANPKSCYYMVDMAHIAGLVATGNHMSPIPYADIVTSTTHKTLRGPRGGIILTNDEELIKKINKAVFPCNQGGPLEHVIAGKAVCFQQALQPSFKTYATNILTNIQAMVKVFKEHDIDMVSDGSDNHLILLDLKKEKFSGADLEKNLEACGIITNKNAVKDDPRPKMETSGVRLGTAAITTRGANEYDSIWIASQIANVIEMMRDNYPYDKDSNKALEFSIIHEKVVAWCKNHPIYNWYKNHRSGYGYDW